VKILSVADEGGGIVSFSYNLHDVTLWINCAQHLATLSVADPAYVLLVECLVVGDEHVRGDSVEIEPVKDVVDVLLEVLVPPAVLGVQHPFHGHGHGGDHIYVSHPHSQEAVQELELDLMRVVRILEPDDLLEAVKVLVPDLLVLSLAFDFVRDILQLHDHVGLTHRDLLPQELEGGGGGGVLAVVQEVLNAEGGGVHLGVAVQLVHGIGVEHLAKLDYVTGGGSHMGGKEPREVGQEELAVGRHGGGK